MSQPASADFVPASLLHFLFRNCLSMLRFASLDCVACLKYCHLRSPYAALRPPGKHSALTTRESRSTHPADGAATPTLPSGRLCKQTSILSGAVASCTVFLQNKLTLYSIDDNNRTVIGEVELPLGFPRRRNLKKLIVDLTHGDSTSGAGEAMTVQSNTIGGYTRTIDTADRVEVHSFQRREITRRERVHIYVIFLDVATLSFARL
eukprot:GHVU01017416.1.p1 GENE.GHVU01017416.1~~GHVU01017416.1.p1  ORF type:complete len:206 (-),score=8.47 GHVU01017416.1:298-915(-)